ncbi:MAG: FAD-dependent oxidoreductase [Deltaproteobacteria bacterium]|nr:FAD-dependent oxidoreductase [Deltaproteobacteria bacterium]
MNSLFHRFWGVSSLRKEISQKLRSKSFGEASLGRKIVSRTLTCFKTPGNLKYEEPLPKTPSSRFQKHLLKKERNDITFSRPGGDARAAEESLVLQKQLGCKVDWWSPDRIKKEFPLVEVNDFVGGTFGLRDGYLDPYALLMAYRSKAVSLGVRFIADFDTRWPIPGRRQGGI